MSTFDWKEYFDNVVKKSEIREKYPIRDEGEVSPDIITLRNTIYNLPIPVKILELRIDRARFPHIEDDVCQLIRYDFTKFGVESVEYCGMIDVDDKKAFHEILVAELPRI